MITLRQQLTRWCSWQMHTKQQKTTQKQSTLLSMEGWFWASWRTRSTLWQASWSMKRTTSASHCSWTSSISNWSTYTWQQTGYLSLNSWSNKRRPGWSRPSMSSSLSNFSTSLLTRCVSTTTSNLQFKSTKRPSYRSKQGTRTTILRWEIPQKSW